MGISHITLITIPVTDQDKAKEFYARLGFEVINDHEMTPDEMPPEPGLRWLQLGTPGGETTMVLATWGVGGLRPGAQHISVACKDVKGLHNELASAGVEASPVFDAPFGAFFSVEDPDGNGVMIVEESGD
ncbi:VOC family protein [Micromonospora aurantiaca (nom. illeg.)]